MVELGAILRSRRRELGWSLSVAAARVGSRGVFLSASQLHRIENGQVPRADQLSALCREYGLPCGVLLDVLEAGGERSVRFSPGKRSARELLAEGDRLVGEGSYARARARYVAGVSRALEEEGRELFLVLKARLGWLDKRQGFYRSGFDRLVEVLEGGDTPPDLRDEVRAVLLRLLACLGWLELAGGLVARVKELAEERGQELALRALAWNSLAAYHRARGAMPEALEATRQAFQLLGRARQRRERLRAGLDLVELLVESGEEAEALAVARRLERSSRAAEGRGVRPEILLRLGRLLLARGRPEKALEVLEEVEDLSDRTGREEDYFRARALRRRALLALGREREARQLEAWLRKRAPRFASGTSEAAEFLAEWSPVGEDNGPQGVPFPFPEPGGGLPEQPGGEA